VSSPCRPLHMRRRAPRRQANRLTVRAGRGAFRRTLEALQNVAKYAEATRATVTLSDGDGRLRFEVTDDGVGSTRAARHTAPACRGSLTGSPLSVGKSTSGRRPVPGRPWRERCRSGFRQAAPPTAAGPLDAPDRRGRGTPRCVPASQRRCPAPLRGRKRSRSRPPPGDRCDKATPRGTGD
jgi:hypothetical protein